MTTSLKDRIRNLRDDRKITQADMAEKLRMSRVTYLSIESGEKQPTIEQIERISAVFGVSAESLLFPDTSDTTSEQAKMAKYRQMCLACISLGGDLSDGKITKTKLAKLLYLVDFTWYKQNQLSMSGLMYRALPRGPVADAFFQMIDEMFESGQILIEAKGAALMISANERSIDSNLNSDELTCIQAVCMRWRNADTQSLVELTHNQAPWQTAELGMPISYDLAREIPDDQLFTLAK